jgi:hypothetical protein
VCPETIMDDYWKSAFATWGDSMVALVYDEIHIIFEAWRSDYPKIPSLRAFFTSAGVLALTATAHLVLSHSLPASSLSPALLSRFRISPPPPLLYCMCVCVGGGGHERVGRVVKSYVLGVKSFPVCSDPERPSGPNLVSPKPLRSQRIGPKSFWMPSVAQGTYAR